MLKKGIYRRITQDEKADAVSEQAKPGYKAGNALLDEIYELGRAAKSIAKNNALVIHGIVEHVVSSKSEDRHRIENTLDALFDCVMLGEGDEDFVRLLNHYRGIDVEGYEFYKKEYDALMK